MKVTLLVLAILFLSASVPAFVPEAAACGGWWDPCCPWFDPDRCVAFDANKRQKAAANEQYFAKREEELRNLADAASWLPGGNYAQKALSAAARAAKAAKEANAAAARGQAVVEADYLVIGAPPSYEAYEYSYWSQVLLYDNVPTLLGYADYTGIYAGVYSECMYQGNGSSVCDPLYKGAANWGLWHMGDQHYKMAVTLDIIAADDLEYIDGGLTAEIAQGVAILRDMAAVSRETGWEFQQ